MCVCLCLRDGIQDAEVVVLLCIFASSLLSASLTVVGFCISLLAGYLTGKASCNQGSQRQNRVQWCSLGCNKAHSASSKLREIALEQQQQRRSHRF